MGRYLLTRLVSVIPVALGVATIVFIVIRLSGDPVQLMLGVNATPEASEALRHQLGLDQPLIIQYLQWLVNVLHGDLGHSLTSGEGVTTVVFRHLGPTLLLTSASLVLAVVFGVALGVLAAVRPYSVIDRISTLVATVGVTVPSFWLGLMLIALLAIALGWLPASGMFEARNPQWSAVPQHLLLPAVTLALPSVAVIARLTRSSTLEISRQEYVRTARAKGLAERVIISRHVLKNALIPVVTMVGLQTGYLLGGAIIVEAVFNWPGVGSLMLTGISTRDFPVVQGAVLYVALAFVLVSTAVDLLYGYLNPRIRFG